MSLDLRDTVEAEARLAAARLKAAEEEQELAVLRLDQARATLDRRTIRSPVSGNVLFETDYPHPVCLYGNVREKIDAALGDHSPEVRHKVLWENAAKLYKIEKPDVAPPVPVG